VRILGAFFILQNLFFMEEPLYFYTFIFESSGMGVDCPFLLEVGTTFQYWGLNWIVSDTNLNCFQV